MEQHFEWDEEKAEENIKKHGIGFWEAVTVFRDPLAITIHDPDHSRDEDRFLTVGMTSRNRIVVTAFTERGPCIRVISCREVSKSEKRKYEEGKFER